MCRVCLYYWYGCQCLACVECACTLWVRLSVFGMCRVCLHGFHLKKASWIPGEMGADSFTTAWWTQRFVMGSQGSCASYPEKSSWCMVRMMASRASLRDDSRGVMAAPISWTTFCKQPRKRPLTTVESLRKDHPDETTRPLGLFPPDTIPFMFPHHSTPDYKDLPCFWTTFWTNSLLLD